MKKYFLFGAIVVLAISGIVISQNFSKISERLTGYEEVPAISTAGNGTFTAQINGDSSVTYQLTYSDAESPVTQAHIHFENRTNNGPIVVYLCSNLTTPAPPPNTQGCPADGGTITGIIDASDVLAANGIEAGNFGEFLGALRAGATYVNVHTVNRTGGEIRSQIDLDPGFGRHDGH